MADSHHPGINSHNVPFRVRRMGYAGRLSSREGIAQGHEVERWSEKEKRRPARAPEVDPAPVPTEVGPKDLQSASTTPFSGEVGLINMLHDFHPIVF